jgi:hypothetical protein
VLPLIFKPSFAETVDGIGTFATSCFIHPLPLSFVRAVPMVQWQKKFQR